MQACPKPPIRQITTDGAGTVQGTLEASLNDLPSTETGKFSYSSTHTARSKPTLVTQGAGKEEHSKCRDSVGIFVQGKNKSSNITIH